MCVIYPNLDSYSICCNIPVPQQRQQFWVYCLLGTDIWLHIFVDIKRISTKWTNQNFSNENMYRVYSEQKPHILYSAWIQSFFRCKWLKVKKAKINCLELIEQFVTQFVNCWNYQFENKISTETNIKMSKIFDN